MEQTGKNACTNKRVTDQPSSVAIIIIDLKHDVDEDPYALNAI